MASVTRDYPMAKGRMSVSPVQWLPGAMSAMLPFFAVPDPKSGILCFRSDDPNLFGINWKGLQNTPVVTKLGVQVSANKGCNFYSAPWAISTLPARDLGRRVQITGVDPAITAYITALYSIVGVVPITLTDWRFEQKGFAKAYQVTQNRLYSSVNGTSYFGGASELMPQVAGVGTSKIIKEPLITDDFTFEGDLIDTYQMKYNTFYVVDTPIVLSAVDTSNPEQPRIYFNLLNSVSVLNNPDFSS